MQPKKIPINTEFELPDRSEAGVRLRAIRLPNDYRSSAFHYRVRVLHNGRDFNTEGDWFFSRGMIPDDSGVVEARLILCAFTDDFTALPPFRLTAGVLGPPALLEEIWNTFQGGPRCKHRSASVGDVVEIVQHGHTYHWVTCPSGFEAMTAEDLAAYRRMDASARTLGKWRFPLTPEAR